MAGRQDSSSSPELLCAPPKSTAWRWLARRGCRMFGVGLGMTLEVTAHHRTRLSRMAHQRRVLLRLRHQLRTPIAPRPRLLGYLKILQGSSQLHLVSSPTVQTALGTLNALAIYSIQRSPSTTSTGTGPLRRGLCTCMAAERKHRTASWGHSAVEGGSGMGESLS